MSGVKGTPKGTQMRKEVKPSLQLMAFVDYGGIGFGGSPTGYAVFVSLFIQRLTHLLATGALQGSRNAFQPETYLNWFVLGALVSSGRALKKTEKPMWLKIWPHADLKHRVLEHLAWLTPESKQHFKMMKDISHKFPSLCISVPGVSESSKRSLPLFKLSMPFAIQIVCTDHWSARNCWWTPEHGAGHHSVTCILANQDPFRMIQGDWSLGVLLVRTLADTRRHSSNLAISWCSCLSLQIRWNTGDSCIAFRKGVTMLQPQCSYLRWTYQSPNNEATASSHRNGKTQPTQRLGCTKGDLTLSFPCAIPLWSSTEQWNCELVSQESQQHRNPSLITGKQMIRCRFQVALGGWSSFSKPWHWNALNLDPFSQSLPGDQQSCARKPEQNQLPSATYRTIFN